MKEEYEISIANKGDYKESKQFRFKVQMTPEEFVAFCDVVICEFRYLQTPGELSSKTT